MNPSRSPHHSTRFQRVSSSFARTAVSGALNRTGALRRAATSTDWDECKREVHIAFGVSTDVCDVHSQRWFAEQGRKEPSGAEASAVEASAAQASAVDPFVAERGLAQSLVGCDAHQNGTPRFVVSERFCSYPDPLLEERQTKTAAG
jgi:hypothetical protein